MGWDYAELESISQDLYELGKVIYSLCTDFLVVSGTYMSFTFYESFF